MIGEIKISQDDKLPKYICANCFSNVKTYIEFKQQIESSHRDFYEPPETIIEVETTDCINQDLQTKRKTKKKNSILKNKEKDSKEDPKTKERCTQNDCEKNIEQLETANEADREKILIDEKRVNADKMILDKHPEFACLSCNYACDSYEVFKVHVKEAHTNTRRRKITKKIEKPTYKKTEKPTHSCDLCSAKFSNKKHLQKHRQIHNSFHCPYCPKTFTNRAPLDNHMASKHHTIYL